MTMSPCWQFLTHAATALSCGNVLGSWGASSTGTWPPRSPPPPSDAPRGAGQARLQAQLGQGVRQGQRAAGEDHRQQPARVQGSAGGGRSRRAPPPPLDADGQELANASRYFQVATAANGRHPRFGLHRQRCWPRSDPRGGALGLVQHAKLDERMVVPAIRCQTGERWNRPARHTMRSLPYQPVRRPRSAPAATI